MPGINVIDNDGDIQRFPDAATWHVDDRGQLHLNSSAGPVASFAKDCWQGASTEDETGPAVKRATLDDVLVELRAIHLTLKAASSRGARSRA
jgi:hypothetical protein